MLYRFERELEALRKEMAEATARYGRSSPSNGGETPSRTRSDEDLLSLGSPISVQKDLSSTSLSSEAGMAPDGEPKKDQ
jgi:hypothetical protein